MVTIDVRGERFHGNWTECLEEGYLSIFLEDRCFALNVPAFHEGEEFKVSTGLVLKRKQFINVFHLNAVSITRVGA